MSSIENNIVNDIDNLSSVSGSNVVSSELIPYACYYNSTTILTENGEMLQTIKIPSFVTNKSKENFYSLRDVLNETIRENSKNANLNFWFQTIRRPVNIIPQNQTYENYTSALIMDKWNKHYKWDQQYANEIYITIILASEQTSVSKSFDFIKAINFSILKNSKLKEFAKMSSLLNSTTKKILDDLSIYDARLLGIKKIGDIYYSEHLKFFSTIINGDREDIKLPINSLSETLIRKKIAYGTNLMQIYNKNGSIYSSVISIKYCSNLLLSQLDKIIQLNQEMIITQSVSFIDKKPVNDEMMKYYEILSLNEDPVILNLSEIGSMLPQEAGEEDRICLTQLLIQVRAKTKEDLQNNVKELCKVLGNLGLVAVREEMFMPTLFWSQLPANFNYIKRFQKISINNVCGYTSLFNFPTGKLTGNYWGDSLIVLKSALDTPYFFSFHIEKNGNTLFIGPKSFRKTKYMNLFLMAATKQAKRIIYIDNTNRSKVFIGSIDGKYYFITRQESKRKLVINPFQMEKTPENLEFILNWLYTIIKREDDGMIKMDENNTGLEQEWEQLKQIIKEKNNEIKKIGDVVDIAKQKKFKNIYNILEKWANPTGYGFIFNEESTLDLFKYNIIGINLNTIVNNEELKVAIFDYITYNLIQKSTGEPTILAIDEGWLLFDNPYFGEKISQIIKQMYDKNIIVVMTTSGADSYETSSIQASVKNIFPTQIFLPNIKATIYQRKVFDISEEESRILSVMKEEVGNILLKHNKNSIISSIDFSFLDPTEQNIFESNNIFGNIMANAKELVNSSQSKYWFPLMMKLVKEYNRVKFEQKMKEQEKRQIQWEEAKQSSDNNAVLKSEG